MHTKSHDAVYHLLDVYVVMMHDDDALEGCLDVLMHDVLHPGSMEEFCTFVRSLD